MPSVDFRHPQYIKSLPLWEKCRDCREGEEAVKAKGALYLPLLAPGNDSSANAAYAGYAMRASFYNATGRTIEALAGMLFIKPPNSKMPKELEDYVKTIGPDSEPLFQMVQTTADEVMVVGRVGALIDAPEGNGMDPYVAIYQAENIINWRVAVVEGRKQPVLIVLTELRDKVDPGDIFAIDVEVIWRVLSLDLNPDTNRYEYSTQIYRKAPRDKDAPKDEPDKWIAEPKITPRKPGGLPLNYIPFVFINTNTTTSDCDKPPVLDLVNINLSHYRTSADLEHGRHFTALPTPYATGTDSDNTDVYLGSTKFLKFPPPQARVGFLEFNGTGLGSLEKALDQKQQQMAVVGGRMLEQQKNQQDKSEATRLRMVGDSATLSGIADQLSIGWSTILQIIADWLSIPDKNIFYAVSREFTIFNVDSAMLTALMQSVQGGLTPYDDWHATLQRMGVVPSQRTVAESRALIEEGLPELPMPKPGTLLNPAGDGPQSSVPNPAGNNGRPTVPQTQTSATKDIPALT